MAFTLTAHGPGLLSLNTSPDTAQDVSHFGLPLKVNLNF
jgi:hypothetical protein